MRGIEGTPPKFNPPAMKPEAKKICDGCNVRPPWEHKCNGKECCCEDLLCELRQGKISQERVNEIVQLTSERDELRWHCDKLVEAMGGLLKQGDEILEVKQELQTLKDAVHWVLGQHGVPEWIINKLKTLSK